MGRVFHGLWVAVAAASLAAAAWAAAPAGGPASAPALDPWLQDLQKRLGSTDPAERAAAEKQLASMAGVWQQPELLQKMAEATSDLELKNLFTQRGNILRARTAERDAMNLPPISLLVRNGDFSSLAEALNTSLDTDVFKPNINSQGASFVLEAKDQPFWDIFRQLQEQQPFTVQSSGNGLSFYSNQMGIRTFAVHGPAMLYVQSTSYRRSVNLQSAEPPSVSLSISLSIMVDPRVTVSRFSSIAVTKAVDELGHSLSRPSQTNNSYAQSNTTSVGFSLNAVEGMGKKLALECDARIAVQTASIEAALDDIQKNLNKDIPLGNRTIRISSFNIQPTMINVQASVNQSRPANAGEEANAAIQYRIVDAAGKNVWSFSAPGGFGTSGPVASAFTAPYRLHVRTASKTQEIPLHFALKDVPLP